MPDGSSGLSLSEMGISTVKKTQKVVQQFAKGAAQQVTGSASSPQAGSSQVPQSGEFIPPQPAGAKLPAAEMPDESAPSASGQVHDLFSASATTQNQQSATFTPPASQPPNETGPAKSGSFDLGSIFGEKNPFSSSKQSSVAKPQAQTPPPDFSLQNAEDQKQIEALRQKLFNEYKEEFLKKAEGKNDKKEETVQEKLEREEKEEEQKRQQEEQKEAQMAPVDTGASSSKMPGLFKKQKKKSIFDILRKPKQGSKEGKLGKG